MLPKGPPALEEDLRKYDTFSCHDFGEDARRDGTFEDDRFIPGDKAAPSVNTICFLFYFVISRLLFLTDASPFFGNWFFFGFCTPQLKRMFSTAFLGFFSIRWHRSTIATATAFLEHRFYTYTALLSTWLLSQHENVIITTFFFYLPFQVVSLV